MSKQKIVGGSQQKSQRQIPSSRLVSPAHAVEVTSLSEGEHVQEITANQTPRGNLNLYKRSHYRKPQKREDLRKAEEAILDRAIQMLSPCTVPKF